MLLKKELTQRLVLLHAWILLDQGIGPIDSNHGLIIVQDWNRVRKSDFPSLSLILLLCVHPLYKNNGALPDLRHRDLVRRTPFPALLVCSTGPEPQGCQVSEPLGAGIKGPCKCSIRFPENQAAPDSSQHHVTAAEHYGLSNVHTEVNSVPIAGITRHQYLQNFNILPSITYISWILCSIYISVDAQLFEDCKREQQLKKGWGQSAPLCCPPVHQGSTAVAVQHLLFFFATCRDLERDV